MQTSTTTTRLDSQPPRAFRHSLDWRLLLPTADLRRMRVLSEEDAELRRALDRVGIPFATPVTFPDGIQGEKGEVQSVALPLGLPVRWVDARPEDQIEFLRSIRRLMGPGGYLLVGFNTTWNHRKRTAAQYHTSTPQRATYQLQEAGFHSVKLFGAMPDLSIAEYIFDLEPRAIHFALYNRFRRKPLVWKVLQALLRSMGVDRLSNYLPCYFAVAQA